MSARSRQHSKSNFKRPAIGPRNRSGNANVRRSRPSAGHGQRGVGGSGQSPPFYAQDVWHEPTDRNIIEYHSEPPGRGFVHPVTVDEIRQRLELLPVQYIRDLEFVQLSRMSRKRAIFPCYGMQWGPTVYLYPIEESLVESFVRPPTPQQRIEARMFGGHWYQDGALWRLKWTPQAIRDFYLNNVLIHEVGHVHDRRNKNSKARERYANWFAIEYGYRASRGRR